jgi:hypothetical protein
LGVIITSTLLLLARVLLLLLLGGLGTLVERICTTTLLLGVIVTPTVRWLRWLRWLLLLLLCGGWWRRHDIVKSTKARHFERSGRCTCRSSPSLGLLLLLRWSRLDESHWLLLLLLGGYRGAKLVESPSSRHLLLLSHHTVSDRSSGCGRWC